MIYLDYAATTPVDPRVAEAMLPFLNEHFGNPSSIHQYGQRTRKAIDEAREFFIKTLGGLNAHNVVFTGGGTESCNMAVFGAALARQNQGKHLVISAIEHPAVMESAEYLRDNFGFELTLVAPDPDGIIHPEKVQMALKPDTIFVSVMYVNNELGTIQPIKKIAKIVRDHGALFHTDACQAPGFLDINADHLGIDLMTINGSKIYGPKGVGLLYIREGVQITPHQFGGGQEFRMRGGTENTANIVGFAKAMELLLEDSETEAQRIAKLRDDLEEALLKMDGVTLNGSKENRTPNFINLHVPGIKGETLVQRLDIEGLATSSGSACASGKVEPSPVLLAMGQSEKQALESLRLSLGRKTTEEEANEALDILKSVIAELS